MSFVSQSTVFLPDTNDLLAKFSASYDQIRENGFGANDHLNFNSSLMFAAVCYLSEVFTKSEEVSLTLVTTQVTNNHERKNRGSIRMMIKNCQMSMYCNTLILLVDTEIFPSVSRTDETLGIATS
ncbi:hypothetical protein [Calothrix sp. PCC 6303]|uniref:hypothetical protein n=1 Tax=Calothrix sp. PCC 6303 TaxID=1170562 RepID=UPI0002A02F03|nr:hypothetical protein [Calothrix sp. PCC 6303]AFZ00552.1 hypothetical protein Cal6303_1505 [Calothrix sp. PCC 6303]